MLRVIVVGAGIAGLSTAIALRRQGHDVLLVERAPALRAEGAGIALFANAIEGLRCLGLADQLADAGTTARWGAILTAHGSELVRLPERALAGTLALARGDLIKTLAAAAGEIRFGAEIAALEHSAAGVLVALADGTRERADLLVGADGINSLVRRTISPDRSPRYAGYTAWRGVSRSRVRPGRFTESWGIGERFGLIDIGGGRTYWFATKNTPAAEPDDPSGRRHEILNRFAHWHSPIAAVVAATDPATILRNDIFYLPPSKRWSAGHIVLVGDAAHATTPGIGQGAAQAIEDTVVLADQLQRHKSIANALNSYTSLRRQRADLVHRLSRRADRVAQIAAPLGCAVRNALVCAVPPALQVAPLAQITRVEAMSRRDARDL